MPDVNLLIYAYNRASPFHQPAATWWNSCLSGNEPVGLVYPVVFSFVRISTATQAYATPLSLEQSEQCVAKWAKRSVVRFLNPARDHVDRVFQLLQAAGSAGGNLTTNAQIAALAISHNATVHTADHDFLRFKGLKCHFPLDAS